MIDVGKRCCSVRVVALPDKGPWELSVGGYEEFNLPVYAWFDISPRRS